MNLHIKVLDGGNNHHIIEAMFKAFAKALDEATSFDPRIAGVLDQGQPVRAEKMRRTKR